MSEKLDFLDAIANAEVGRKRTDFIGVGLHKVKIENVKRIESRVGAIFVIVEMAIVESDNPGRSPGQGVKTMYEVHPDQYGSGAKDCKRNLAEIIGVDPTEIERNHIAHIIEPESDTGLSMLHGEVRWVVGTDVPAKTRADGSPGKPWVYLEFKHDDPRPGATDDVIPF